FIGEAGEDISSLLEEADSSEESVDEIEEENTVAETVIEEVETDSSDEGLVRRTPAARKLATEKGIDLRDVKGTGPNNRVHLEDVEEYVSKQRQLPNDQTDQAVHRDIVPLAGVRKVIADRMSESWNSAPHVSMNTKIDMTETMNIRQQLLPEVEQKTSYRLSYTEIIMKATAAALEENVIINATLEGDNIVLHRDVHLGLAVAIPNGLVVPVVHDVANKGLAQLTSESKQLAHAAKTNRLLPEQMENATFTISNLGMYAVDSFTPIINQPQTAILGISQINEEVVSVDGEFEVRPMCTFTLSFDHRVIDGAPAAKFLTDLKYKLENPYTLLF
ncbi:MAG TPA: dihydrolipoamide acetyltransferase family protein, partial [Virgibacillus sp.]|nr:dihydrolipoamide acetyltransferase family protein [Virgibacillus sp.]